VSLNVGEGLVCLLVGVILMTGARLITNFSRELWEYRLRRRPGREVNALTRVISEASQGRIAITFWRACGLLWIFAGISLILDPGLAVRTPWRQ
jgi:hypothetical protein